MELILDTETTGLTPLSFVTERNYQQWPRLVQIAWGIYKDGCLVESNSTIIQPNGFIIPVVAEGIHGISQHRAVEEGRKLSEELGRLDVAMRHADRVVAHNVRYDLGVLNSESMRLGRSLLQPSKLGCTAMMGQAFLKKEKRAAASAFPRLKDLYRELFDADYSPCHEALSDVKACARVYFHLISLGY